jgi:hypothetical protein
MGRQLIHTNTHMNIQNTAGSSIYHVGVTDESFHFIYDINII